MTAASAIRQLKSRFEGTLLAPGDRDYDAARTVFNAMIDRRPALIAQCTSAADVVEAVHFAREQTLLVSVRCTGHNIGGYAVCDDGLVIDLSRMKAITVNPAARTVRVAAGCNWGEVNDALQPYGLAATGGFVSVTGVSGLTLGGGLGWLMRSYGLACDNLIGAEVVTADGNVVRASASENADLFWALRGGGGNFGVVTTLEYQLHPVTSVVGGILFYPLAKARELVRFYREVTRTTPDNLTVFAAMLHTPEGEKVCGLAMCYNGPAEEAEHAIQLIREFDTPVGGNVGPVAYTALQSMLDAGFPSGLHVHWRSEFLTSIPDAFIEAAVSAYEQVPSPLSSLLIEHFGGAVSRVPRDATAFDLRDADYNFVIVSRWADPAEAERNVAWARAISSAARPFTNGRVYLNYIGEGEAPDRVRASFAADKLTRLASIKKKYDPTNLFRINQNIAPA